MKNIYIILIIIFSVVPVLSRGNSNDNELRVTLQSSLISLDPGGIQDSQSLHVARQVNCQFVRSQGAVFVLDAAESIKYLTPLKIALKINNKVRFHDGTPVTAKDALASFNYIKTSRNILGNLYIWIDKIEAVDDKTIMFSLKRQVPQFLKVLSSTNFNIFKKEFLDKASKDKSHWKKPVGCGGYKVAEFNNDSIKLTPIAQGLPITFYRVNSNQIEASELDKYDIVTLNVVGNSKELNDFNAIDMFDPLQFYVGLNAQSKMWKNKYERCEFLTKLDIKNLLKSYGNRAIEANDILPKGTLGYNSNKNFNDQLNDLAKNAFKNKSTKNGKQFCLAYLTVSVQDEKKKEYLDIFRKIYPNFVVKSISNTKKFGREFVNENCDALIFAWKSYYLDGYEYLTFFEDNDANFSGGYNKDSF